MSSRKQSISIIVSRTGRRQRSCVCVSFSITLLSAKLFRSNRSCRCRLERNQVPKVLVSSSSSQSMALRRNGADGEIQLQQIEFTCSLLFWSANRFSLSLSLPRSLVRPYLSHDLFWPSFSKQVTDDIVAAHCSSSICFINKAA